MREPLVLSKPSGIPCFPFHSSPGSDCLLHRLLQKYPEQENKGWPDGFEGGIAHRLDVATSGQILVALDPEHLIEMRALFAKKKLQKTYYFLSERKVPWKKNSLALPIAHERRRAKRMIVQRGQNTPKKGKWYPAETFFEHVKGRFGLHLWKAQMRTGVMHQIRAHGSFAGIALLGDRLYAGGEAPKYFPVNFALHHYGVQYDEWNLQKIPLPEWWPKWTKDLNLD
jgi:23S rRNA pseudouridine1911/1915/1917 synthase